MSIGAGFSGGPDSVKLVGVMKGLRRRLRLAVIAWLSFQVVSLSALVPLDCCDAHRPTDVVRAENCHERADSPYCPMRARNGQACPMHQQAEAAAHPHAHHQQTAAEEHPSHHAGQEEQASSEESSKNQCSKIFIFTELLSMKRTKYLKLRKMIIFTLVSTYHISIPNVFE